MPDRRTIGGVARAAGVVLLAAAQGCRLAMSDPTPVLVTSRQVTIAWDPPRFEAAASVVSYRIYARTHGTLPWSLVNEVPAEGGTGYTLSHETFGDGVFDVAVCAVDARNRSSALHSSTDAEAAPVGGWYIVWWANQ